MTKTIQGVPDAIDRKDYIAFVEQLGITPADVRKITLEPDMITVVVFERDEDGKRILRCDGLGFVKHRVCIRVLDLVKEGESE